MLLCSVNQDNLSNKKRKQREKKTRLQTRRGEATFSVLLGACAFSPSYSIGRASQLSGQRCMSPPLSSANREKGLACVASVACRLGKSREDQTFRGAVRKTKIYRDSSSPINLSFFVLFSFESASRFLRREIRAIIYMKIKYKTFRFLHSSTKYTIFSIL